MINFDEEVAKFQPATEISDAEEAILKNDISDLSDIIDKILEDRRGE